MNPVEPADQPRLARFEPTRREPGLHLPPAFREPVRLATLVGSMLLVFGAISMWVEVYLPYRGWFELSSFEGANDGGINLELGLGLFAIAWADRLWSNRLAVLVVAPFVLALAALVDLKTAFDTATTYLNGEVHNARGQGYLLPGFWLTVGGAALAALAGVIRIRRARRTTQWNVGIARTFAGAAAGGTAGGVLGFVVGITIGTMLTSGAINVTSGALPLFAIAFAFLGAWLGAAVGNYLAAATKRA